MASKRPAGSLWPWLGIALIVILLDQFAKTLILGMFEPNASHTVTSFFNIVRVHNHGAAFSFLAGASGWQRWFFVGLGAAAAIFIVWMLRSHGGQRLFGWALALILGGALGNVHRPAAARLCGRLHPGALQRRLLPVVQRRRQRDHDRRGLPDPRRTDARAPRALRRHFRSEPGQPRIRSG